MGRGSQENNPNQEKGTVNGVEDEAIVALYWARDEEAIRETDSKYGRMLLRLADRILRSPSDSEEALNDSYLAAWNSMPENRPDYLGGYMAKIIRNLSLNRYEKSRTAKRGGNAILCELSECVTSDFVDPASDYENEQLRLRIETFLSGLDTEKRVVFVKRYFFSEALSDISEETGLSESKLKSMLLRMRRKLKEVLEEVER